MNKQKISKVIFAILLLLAFHMFSKTSIYGFTRDLVIDIATKFETYILSKDTIFQKIYNKENLEKTEELKRNIVFVDINSEVLEKWKGKDKALIPRDKLAKLITKVSEKNPKVIVVDIDFFPKSCYIEDKSENYDICCKNDKILKDTLLNILEKNKNINFVFVAKISPKSKNIEYPFFYTELKEKFKNRVFLTTPSFYISEYDNTARYINFYTKFYNEENKEKVALNTSLVAYLIFINQKEKIGNLETQLLNKKSLELNIENKKIYINNENLITNRLRFPIKVVYGNHWGLKIENVPIQNIIYPIEIEKKNLDNIKNKIVIIGSSDVDRGDVFKTPVGYMAGMYILANGIISIAILQFKFLQFMNVINYILLLMFIFAFLNLENIKHMYSEIFEIEILNVILGLFIELIFVAIGVFLILRFNVYFDVLALFIIIISYKILSLVKFFPKILSKH